MAEHVALWGDKTNHSVFVVATDSANSVRVADCDRAVDSTSYYRKHSSKHWIKLRRRIERMGDEISHLSTSLSLVSRNDSKHPNPALLTNSSIGRMASTACCVLSQSDRSTHTGWMPGHCNAINELIFATINISIFSYAHETICCCDCYWCCCGNHTLGAYARRGLVLGAFVRTPGL